MTISILTVTYQCEKYINRCYYSILSQLYTDWEWIVVDDGSNDNTRVIMESYQDKRIKYFCLNANQGRGRARNFGLDKMTGEWCVILDMDDLMDPSRLTNVIYAKEAGYDYMVSSTRLIDDLYQTTGIRNVFYNNELRIFTHATLCIKSEILRKIRYSDSRYAEDQRVILLVTEGRKGKLLDIPLYIYHENASLNLKSAILSNLAAFKSISTILFKERSKKIDFSIITYTFSFAIKFVLLNMFRLWPSLYKLSYSARSGGTSTKDSLLAPEDDFLIKVKGLYPVNGEDL